MNNTALIPLVLIGAVASICDIRWRRIPNVVTFGGALAAVAVNLALGGPSGAAWSIAGWTVGCALFLPFFILGGMGAGDVKLIAAVGAWVGPFTAFWAVIYAAFAGGALALVVALTHGYLRRAFSNVWALLGYWKVVGLKPLDELTLASARGPRLAYALPITVGSLMAWWLK